MLEIGNTNHPGPKCLLAQVQLPQVIDERQPPTKKKPFSCVFDRPFVHTIDVLSTDTASQALVEKLQNTIGALRYAKVHFKLKDLIETGFSDHYVKAGNIVLLSEGRPGVDNTFRLHDGVLHLELNQSTYERAGLTGKVVRSPGKKHAKDRFAIELNLRLPSMVRGHKLFNRVMYAFENALTETLTWLFFDLRDHSLSLQSMAAVHQRPSATVQKGLVDSSGRRMDELAFQDTALPTSSEKSSKSDDHNGQEQTPLSKHYPLLQDIELQTIVLHDFRVPTIPRQLREQDKETASDLLEWLTLAMAGCHRLRNDDRADPTICRYAVPDLTTGPTDTSKDGEHATTDTKGDSTTDAGTFEVQNLSRVRYRGLLPAAITAKILTSVIRTSGKEDIWTAMRLQCFDGKDDCMILVRDGKAMIWEHS